ncbi:carbonic anhydrase [Mycobacterium helveticum]|uniref:Carbonic anhydrase n=1 Tax=Mycobacterium helveticum TaxID=2592811 RepID=A0A557XZ03_9MYCO|nr:carbonic anhydrase [Mycobacterium helveticum]TVS89493.1 carbonic anhydrase [Mycobacterium helveticum]TVS91437.1 carbonic anhydrase [Mycobacterium helveticum]
MSNPPAASNPSAAWQRLRAGNERCCAALTSRADVATERQTPRAAVFRCADSPMASEAVFGQSRGSLVEISNWGHVVDTGVLAGLEYAVGTLRTPVIAVLGHPDCAAMHTALNAWKSVSFPDGAVRAVVEHGISSLTRLNTTIGTADELSAAHVAQTGVTLLHKSPLIAKAVDGGQTAIVCLVSDRNDGRLRVCATFGDVSETASPLFECV